MDTYRFKHHFNLRDRQRICLWLSGSGVAGLVGEGFDNPMGDALFARNGVGAHLRLGSHLNFFTEGTFTLKNP